MLTSSWCYNNSLQSKQKIQNIPESKITQPCLLNYYPHTFSTSSAICSQYRRVYRDNLHSRTVRHAFHVCFCKLQLWLAKIIHTGLILPNHSCSLQKRKWNESQKGPWAIELHTLLTQPLTNNCVLVCSR